MCSEKCSRSLNKRFRTPVFSGFYKKSIKDMNLIFLLTYSRRFDDPLKWSWFFDLTISIFYLRLKFRKSDFIFLRKSFTTQMKLLKDFLKKMESEFLNCNHNYKKGRWSNQKTTTTSRCHRTYENTSVKKSSSYV